MQFLASTASSSSSLFSNFSLFGVLILMFVLMYFFMIRPQKKKEKDAREMRDNLVVGDEITTIGGIIGRVVSIKEDTIVIETGADREKIRIKKWAIQTVDTLHDDK